MLIKYSGGRTWYDVTLNRKSYVFTKENNRTLDIKDQAAINYILSLPNRGEFTVIEAPNAKVIETVNKLKCVKCEFTAKTEQGLLVHSARHNREDK